LQIPLNILFFVPWQRNTIIPSFTISFSNLYLHPTPLSRRFKHLLTRTQRLCVTKKQGEGKREIERVRKRKKERVRERERERERGGVKIGERKYFPFRGIQPPMKNNSRLLNSFDVFD
jgi:hypothetical protein